MHAVGDDGKLQNMQGLDTDSLFKFPSCVDIPHNISPVKWTGMEELLSLVIAHVCHRKNIEFTPMGRGLTVLLSTYLIFWAGRKPWFLWFLLRSAKFY